MTEQEIVSIIDTYINSVSSSAQCLSWCYFLSGILFCLIIDSFSDSVIKFIKKYKQKSKNQEDKNKSAD